MQVNWWLQHKKLCSATPSGICHRNKVNSTAWALCDWVKGRSISVSYIYIYIYIWLGSTRRLSRCTFEPIIISSVPIKPSSTVRDLGAYTLILAWVTRIMSTTGFCTPTVTIAVCAWTNESRQHIGFSVDRWSVCHIWSACVATFQYKRSQ